MKNLKSLLFFLAMACVGTFEVSAQITPSKRVTTFEPGKPYLIYNSATPGTTAQQGSAYSGFLGANTKIHYVVLKGTVAPVDVNGLAERHQWTFEQDPNNAHRYAVKNVRTHEYIQDNGRLDFSPVYYTFTEWSASKVGKAVMNSFRHMGDVCLYGQITPSEKLFTVSTSASSAWATDDEGNFYDNETKAHPFAVYECSRFPLNDRWAKLKGYADNLVGNMPAGIGYPTERERNDFQALSNGYSELNYYTERQYVYWGQALEDFVTTDQVIRPVSGKAYTFTNYTKSGKRSYLNWDGARQNIVPAAVNGALPETAVFVCRKMGDKFMFVNGAGKYFVWSNGSNKACVDHYAANTCDWQLVAGAGMEKNFDKLGFFGLSSSKGYLTVNADSKSFVAASGIADDNSSSSYWKLEEVTYNNNIVKTNRIRGNKMMSLPKGAYAVATFSSPFPTDLPKGMHAFYAKTADVSGSAINLVELHGTVPADQGVILVSDSVKTNYYMIPSVQRGDEFVKNLLGETARATKVLGKGDYIISNATDEHGSVQTQFYPVKNNGKALKLNKAYLHLDNLSLGACTLNFSGEMTDIEDVETEKPFNAAVYDMNGKRVAAPVKGEVYVSNGKKFINK